MKYVPILQSKEGELRALANLSTQDKSQICPIIQLLPDAKENRRGDYISDRVKSIVNAWSFLDNRIYFDAVNLITQPPSVTERFFTESRSAGVNIIPVFSPSTPINNIKSYADPLVLGLCLRVGSNDLTGEIINDSVRKVKIELGLNQNEIDLLIDYSYVTPSTQTHFLNSFKQVYSTIHNPEQFRNIIVASGSFPSMLTAVPKDSVMPIPRIEWNLWNQIRKIEGIRSLIYADYGNVNPSYDPAQAERRGTCSIKYTDVDNYYIFKGVKPADSPIGNQQYRLKAKDLIMRSFYSGPTFSWGDQYILDCADTREGPGSSATWVQVTQNHHFVKILNLLRNQT